MVIFSILTQLLLVSGDSIVSDAVPGSGTWTLSTAPSAHYSSLVSSYSGQNLFALDIYGDSAQSSYYGATWSVGYNQGLDQAVCDSNAQNITAFEKGTLGGYVDRSTDYGASWLYGTCTPDTAVDYIWADAASDSTGSIVYIVSEYYYDRSSNKRYPGSVYISTDGTTTWSANMIASTSYSATAVACSSDGQIALYGTSPTSLDSNSPTALPHHQCRRVLGASHQCSSD